MSYITNQNYCPKCGGRMRYGSGYCFACGYEETQYYTPNYRKVATKRVKAPTLKGTKR